MVSYYWKADKNVEKTHQMIHLYTTLWFYHFKSHKKSFFRLRFIVTKGQTPAHSLVLVLRPYA